MMKWRVRYLGPSSGMLIFKRPFFGRARQRSHTGESSRPAPAMSFTTKSKRRSAERTSSQPRGSPSAPLMRSSPPRASSAARGRRSRRRRSRGCSRASRGRGVAAGPSASGSRSSEVKLIQLDLANVAIHNAVVDPLVLLPRVDRPYLRPPSLRITLVGVHDSSEAFHGLTERVEEVYPRVGRRLVGRVLNEPLGNLRERSKLGSQLAQGLRR